MTSSSTPPSYPRRTILAAADMLKALGHSGLGRFLLELDLPDEGVSHDGSLTARTTSLAQFAIKNPEYLSPERRTVAYEIILRATELWREGTNNNLSSNERGRFASAMQQDGRAILLEAAHGVPEAAPLPGDAPTTLDAAIHSSTPTLEIAPMPAPQNIFLVHGHDHAARDAVARFLAQLDFNVIILSEQANQGQTIIEKFETHAEQAGFAVALFTEDDLGGSSSGTIQERRARQNVVFELGYFRGTLGKGKTCLLRRGEVEIPSDLYGVVYIDMDKADGWKAKLARELKAAGLKFDSDKVFQ